MPGGARARRHGQGVTTTHTYIGVDLSRDRLDILDPRDGHSRVANTAAQIRAWLGRPGPGDLPVFEATSGCDGLLLRLSAEAGRPVCRLNPLHAWHFAQSLNLPRTDRVDAAMLARMGAERGLAPDPAFEAERAELAELSGRRDQLKRMETREKNRLDKTVSAAVKADIRSLLRLLARRIARIEAAIAAFLERHPASARAVRLLQSLPGIGRVTSVTLLAAMPELGSCDRRAIASLGGLAPKARESGKWRGRRGIGAGRRHLRRALYMAALNAMRHASFCAGLVRGLRDKGTPGKIIAIAVARKMLTTANAVLRDQTPFKPES